MKRLVSLLLSVLLLTSAATAFAVEGAYEKSAEPIVLTTAQKMDSTRSFDESDPEKKSMEENRWVNTYKDVLNVELKYEWMATDSDSESAKWSTAIASNNLPDFAYVGDTIYQMLLDSDLVADCSEAWNEYISDEYKSIMDASSIAQMTFDGALRGFPFPRKGYHGAAMLFVRQDWLDQLNLSYPNTLDEMVAVVKAFQEAKLGGEDTMGLFTSFGGASEHLDGHIKGLLNTLGAYLDYWVEKDGKVTWSNIQPEMREALLTIQGLYADGVINKDFAVVTPDQAQEYIAGGKAGIFFTTSWNTTTTINALYENDPNAKIVSRVIKAADGSDCIFQTNTPSTRKIFVNANCSPEKIKAIAQMINLSYELTNSTDPETYAKYCMDTDGFIWFKYLPYGDKPVEVINDLAASNEIRVAYESGVKSAAEYEWKYSDAKGWYDPFYAAINGGDSPAWYYLTFGPEGTYTKLYDAYNAGLQLANGYLGLPTPTQQMMGDVINDQLTTAMLEVIMGADISVYDKACEVWLTSGGQMIIDEVNAALGK